MKATIQTLIILTATLAGICLTGAAHADPKAPKPVVCTSWEAAGKLTVCTDGKRPWIVRLPVVVTIAGPEGEAVKVVVGYR